MTSTISMHAGAANKAFRRHCHAQCVRHRDHHRPRCPPQSATGQMRAYAAATRAATFAEVTVTPATLLDEFAKLFPPVPPDGRPCESAARAPPYFPWDTLFMVRHQEINAHPMWSAPATATTGKADSPAGSCGVVNTRSGLWQPRGSLAAKTRWHTPRTRAQADAVTIDSNCAFDTATATCTTRRTTDAVLHVWRTTLAHMQGRGLSRDATRPVYGWATPAVFAIYHYNAASQSPLLLNLPRLVGTYYAIPGLPQPVPNVTSPTARQRAAKECVEGTVLTLQMYLSLVVPSYKPGMEKCHGNRSDITPDATAASDSFFFQPPEHFQRSTTTRGRVANRQMFWQTVPLAPYLQSWPRCSLDAFVGTEADQGTASDGTGLAPFVAADVPMNRDTVLEQQGVGVLLLLENEVCYFAFLMHAHNPFLRDKTDLQASLAASVNTAFIQSPLTETSPERVMTATNALTGADSVRPSTILVRDQEQKQYHLPYHTDTGGQSLSCQAEHTSVQDRASPPSYILRWYAEEDTRGRARAELLRQFLSRPRRGRSHKRGGTTPPDVCVFSPFPPPSKLLRNASVFTRPHALAEEMRYGLLLRHD